eukprot:2255144-Rhodomonas_salina.1
MRAESNPSQARIRTSLRVFRGPAHAHPHLSSRISSPSRPHKRASAAPFACGGAVCCALRDQWRAAATPVRIVPGEWVLAFDFTVCAQTRIRSRVSFGGTILRTGKRVWSTDIRVGRRAHAERAQESLEIGQTSFFCAKLGC